MLTKDRDNYIQSWVGVKKTKIEVILNGININKFSNASPSKIENIPEHATVIGMVARMCPPKDYITFIKATKLIQFEDPDVHFIAVGDGRDRPSYEDLVKQLGVTNFHFLGSRSDVPSLLRRMKINVLATRNEGLPITLLESMASGCAVVASDIPPVRFVLGNGNSGLLVPVGDSSALAQAIKALLADDSLRNSIVSKGIERVHEFSSQKMAQQYINLYSRLICGSGNK